MTLSPDLKKKPLGGYLFAEVKPTEACWSPADFVELVWIAKLGNISSINSRLADGPLLKS